MTDVADEEVVGSNPPRRLRARDIEKMNALRAAAKKLEDEAAKIEAWAKDLTRRDQNRDKLLLGVAALELAKHDPSYAQALSDQAAKLPAKDIRHLKREGDSLLAVLMSYIEQPSADRISVETQEPDTDVPETAWFESPMDRRAVWTGLDLGSITIVGSAMHRAGKW